MLPAGPVHVCSSATRLTIVRARLQTSSIWLRSRKCACWTLSRTEPPVLESECALTDTDLERRGLGKLQWTAGEKLACSRAVL